MSHLRENNQKLNCHARQHIPTKCTNKLVSYSPDLLPINFFHFPKLSTERSLLINCRSSSAHNLDFLDGSVLWKLAAKLTECCLDMTQASIPIIFQVFQLYRTERTNCPAIISTLGCLGRGTETHAYTQCMGLRMNTLTGS